MSQGSGVLRTTDTRDRYYTAKLGVYSAQGITRGKLREPGS